MTWQQELETNVTTAAQLAEYMPMTDSEQKTMEEIIERWPMSVTRYYLSLIDFKDPDDPLARLCIPSLHEAAACDGLADQSGEGENTKVAGLQHKYSSTALILSTNVCSLYCRHCFRKRLVGLDETETAKYFEHIYDYVRSHEELTNVLISGGDAFLNNNRRIEQLLQSFSEMEHLRYIRFGTRTPVVFPNRINNDPELLDILEKYGRKKRIYISTQFNHPRELTPEAVATVENLRRRNIIVNNQSVLLRGVNDDPAVLAELMNGLTENGIIPYYLFQCRPAAGVKNQFQVPLSRAVDIVSESKTNLGGHAKRFRFIMSHKTGKIEILGKTAPNTVVFKYHNAKDPSDNDRLFTCDIDSDTAWLTGSF